MGYEREELHRLTECMAELELLDAKLAEEQDALRIAEEMLRELEHEKDEKKDVLYQLVNGKKPLNVERDAAKYQKAYQASIGAEKAYRDYCDHVARLRSEFHAMEEKYRELSACKKEYARAIEEKTAAIRASGLPDADRLSQLENEIAAMKRKKEALYDTVAEGNRVLGVIRSMLNVLRGDREKSHCRYRQSDRVETARGMVEGLQTQLSRFKESWFSVCDKMSDRAKSARNAFDEPYFEGLIVGVTRFHGTFSCKKMLNRTSDEVYKVISACEDLLATADREIKVVSEHVDRLVFDSEIE